MEKPLIVITGHTASGKTRLATKLAFNLNAEVISADSRQIYKYMDIGTGKDLDEYTVNNLPISYHLIDNHLPGYEYNVFEFQHNFFSIYNKLTRENKQSILCGGTGLYIEAVLKAFKLFPVPQNEVLRTTLELNTLSELSKKLAELRDLHNVSDIDTKKRAIRAIEIELYYKEHEKEIVKYNSPENIVFAINLPVEERWQRIHQRLTNRLDQGMISEVENLLSLGLTSEQIKYYGLEYKYTMLLIEKKLTKEEYINQLYLAIRQFAKRQMTYLRHMEKNGIKLHWIDGRLDDETKLEQIFEKLKQFYPSVY